MKTDMKSLRNNWLEILTGTALSVVVISTFLQVFFRFVLKIPSPWTEEVTRIGFAYMVFLGAALGVKYSRHLSVDVIANVPSRLKNIVVGIGYAMSIVFVVIFSYYGWIHTNNSKILYTPTLEISLFYLYIVIPISGVIMIYYLIKNMRAELKGEMEENKL